MSNKEAQHLLDRAKISIIQQKKYSFYTAILMMFKVEWTESVPMAAISLDTLFINPTYWVARDPEGHIHDVMHELFHVIYLHLIRIEAYPKANKDKYNLAADYSINNDLIAMGLQLDNTFVVEPKYKGKSTEEIYNLIPDPSPDYTPDIKPEGDSDKSLGEQEEKIKEMLSQAKLMAENNNSWSLLSADLKRHVNNLVDPLLPWQTILQNITSEYKKEDYSYSRRNRRYEDIYLPSLYSLGMGKISVYIDASGSITNQEYIEFLSEVEDIRQQLHPSSVVVHMWGTHCDNGVEVFEGEELLDKVRLVGKGGTNADTFLKSINETLPELAICFTDGYFSKPRTKIDTNIIWVITGTAKYIPKGMGRIIHYSN